jgi:WhiB family redox-sensing transcriptional regulator
VTRRQLAPDDPRHGTVNGYNNFDCRCPDCREAQRIRNANRPPQSRRLTSPNRGLVGDWADHAACKGQTDLMYPADAMGVLRAKAICARCPVTHHCLVHAITHSEDLGVWGGTSIRERGRMQQQRRRAS